MPRDKNKKFLKQKYAQQHKKTAARKHEHEDDISLPAPIHHLDDAVSKKQKKNKYASQSHKEARVEANDSGDERNNWNIEPASDGQLGTGTSAEIILQSFEQVSNIPDEKEIVSKKRNKNKSMNDIAIDYLDAIPTKKKKDRKS